MGFRDFEDGWIRDAWTDPFLRGTWLVLDAQGAAAAYLEMESIDPTSSVDSWIAVHPDHRATQLRPALLDLAEARARELADGSPAVLWTSGVATDPSVEPAALAAGFRHVRTFWHMERPLDGSYAPGPLPQGVSIRPVADQKDERRVFEVMDEAFHGHFGFVRMTFEEWRRANDPSLSDPSLVLLAYLEDSVAGAVTARIPGDRGWIDDLGVRRDFRGRGIGAALLRASFASFAARGVSEARLNVDSENETGATRLYSSVGMTVRREFRVFEKPLGAGVSSAP